MSLRAPHIRSESEYLYEKYLRPTELSDNGHVRPFLTIVEGVLSYRLRAATFRARLRLQLPHAQRHYSLCSSAILAETKLLIQVTNQLFLRQDLLTRSLRIPVVCWTLPWPLSHHLHQVRSSLCPPTFLSEGCRLLSSEVALHVGQSSPGGYVRTTI